MLVAISYIPQELWKNVSTIGVMEKVTHIVKLALASGVCTTVYLNRVLFLYSQYTLL